MSGSNSLSSSCRLHGARRGRRVRLPWMLPFVWSCVVVCACVSACVGVVCLGVRVLPMIIRHCDGVRCAVCVCPLILMQSVWCSVSYLGRRWRAVHADDWRLSAQGMPEMMCVRVDAASERG